MIPKLALFAALIVGCFREQAGFDLFPNHMNDVSHLPAKVLAEDHPIPSPWSAVPNESFRNLHLQHLLKAKSLGAELEVGGSTVPDA